MCNQKQKGGRGVGVITKQVEVKQEGMKGTLILKQERNPNFLT